MKILIFLISLSVFSAQVPLEWLGQSENKNIQGEKAVDNAIDEIFNLQSETLDEVTAQKNQPGGKYFLGGLITLFGVSTSGTIGVLGLSGASAAQIIWAKDILPERPDPTALFNPDIELSTDSPKEELLGKIEAVSEILVKSRKVKDEDAVKKNLMEAALNFQKTMKGMEINFAPKYRATGFAVVFGISAAGQVSFGTVGGSVTVTMVWTFGKNKSRISRSDFSQKLSTLANLIAEDISMSSKNAQSLANYKIEDIWVGVLFNVGGLVGVASVNGQVGGYLIFKPQTEAKANQNFSDKGDITLGSDSKFTKVARKKIRKGLDLAFKIGGHFAKRAEKQQDKKWKILMINANFSLGLSGSLGIVTVGATPTIKVHFLNKNFAKVDP